jgi:hypothetical protein
LPSKKGITTRVFIFPQLFVVVVTYLYNSQRCASINTIRQLAPITISAAPHSSLPVSAHSKIADLPSSFIGLLPLPYQWRSLGVEDVGFDKLCRPRGLSFCQKRNLRKATSYHHHVKVIFSAVNLETNSTTSKQQNKHSQTKAK